LRSYLDGAFLYRDRTLREWALAVPAADCELAEFIRWALGTIPVIDCFKGSGHPLRTRHVALRNRPADDNPVRGDEKEAIDVHVEDCPSRAVMEFRLAGHSPFGLLDRAEGEGPLHAIHVEFPTARCRGRIRHGESRKRAKGHGHQRQQAGSDEGLCSHDADLLAKRSGCPKAISTDFTFLDQLRGLYPSRLRQACKKHGGGWLRAGKMMT
jgi:hypothetical protein